MFSNIFATAKATDLIEKRYNTKLRRFIGSG